MTMYTVSANPAVIEAFHDPFGQPSDHSDGMYSNRPCALCQVSCDLPGSGSFMYATM